MFDFLRKRGEDPQEQLPLTRDFEDIAADAVERKEGAMLTRLASIEGGVVEDVGGVLDGEELRETHMESNKLTGVYIDEDTMLVIPKNLIQQYPFFLIGQGAGEIKISKLRELSFKDKQTAIRMLPKGDITIKNDDITHDITLNTRLSLPGGKGSLNDYLRHPHHAQLQEMT